MFYNTVKIIANFVLRILYRVSVTGVENVPASGKFIICANHFSNWDPIFVSIAFPRKISWMGKQELFKNKILGKFLSKLDVFPVDRDGSDISAIKKALRVLKNEEVLGIFPEGTRVDGFHIDNAKPGVAMLTIKSKSELIPIYINSNYKLFNKVEITIGEPIDFYPQEGQSMDYTEISQNILRSIYELK